MLPQPARAAALALAAAALLLAPAAWGQVDPGPGPGGVEGGPDTGPTPEPPPGTEPPPPPPVGQFPPDLYPTGLTVNASDVTQPTQICVQITDIAPMSPSPATYVETPAGPFTVRLDLYSWNGENWTLDQQPEARHTDQMSNTVNQRATVCFTLELRSAYYLANALVDSNSEVAESNESNNARPAWTFFAVEISPRAELEFVSTEVSPSPAPSGRAIGFVAFVRNVGERPSAPTVVDVLDGTRTLARLTLPTLQVGQTVSVQTAVQSDDLRPGQHTARFVIDPIRNVTEYARSNNARNVTFFVLQHPEPDLVVRNLSYEGTLLARRGLTLHARIQNAGNLSSVDSAIARLYLDGVPVQNATFSKLRPNELTQADFFLVPPEGNHTLRVVADADDVVPELNESNNDASVNVTILPPPTLNATPNLVVERLGAAPNDPAPGEVVTITAIVENLGDKASNATTLQLFANGEPIGRARVPPVTAERRVSVTYRWAPPPVGLYTLRAFVDPEGLVNETDEFDNNGTLFTEILPPGGLATLPDPNATLPPDSDTNGTLPKPPPDSFPTPPTPIPNGTSSGPATSTSVQITELTVSTKPVPGGVSGKIIAGIRNPTFAPVGRMTVTFRVDGAPVKEILVSGLASAATTSASSGDVTLPGGTHSVSVEVRVVGSTAPAANATRTYTADAGSKASFLGIPGPGPIVVIAGVAVGAIILRRRT